jgi:cysteine synthase A
MPAGTSPAKVALIERYCGSPHFVASASLGAAEAQRLAAATPRAHFLDQFTFASIATDFRGNNNLAASLFAHLPTPSRLLTGARNAEIIKGRRAEFDLT